MGHGETSGTPSFARYPARDVVHLTVQCADPDAHPDWAAEVLADAAYEGALYAAVQRVTGDTLALTAPVADARLWTRVAAQNGADVTVSPPLSAALPRHAEVELPLLPPASS
ncbi:MAG: hypothetical protein K6T26_00605 [Alicyclobacillus sp.]|nr:hypothetical protein [Alicyclobacillus sp.]